jgi:hypothetical protein
LKWFVVVVLFWSYNFIIIFSLSISTSKLSHILLPTCLQIHSLFVFQLLLYSCKYTYIHIYVYSYIISLSIYLCVYTHTHTHTHTHTRTRARARERERESAICIYVFSFLAWKRQPPQLATHLLSNPESPPKLYINRIQLTVALSVEASWAFFVSILFGMFVLVILVWFQFGESCWWD